MLGLDLLVVATEREALGLGEPGLQLRGELVESHAFYFGSIATISSTRL